MKSPKRCTKDSLSDWLKKISTYASNVYVELKYEENWYFLILFYTHT